MSVPRDQPRLAVLEVYLDIAVLRHVVSLGPPQWAIQLLTVQLALEA